jgi:hypothetical protein
VIADLAVGREHKFALERAVFLTVLHRLFAGGSDRAADRWREDYAIAGLEGLAQRAVSFHAAAQRRFLHKPGTITAAHRRLHPRI